MEFRGKISHIEGNHKCDFILCAMIATSLHFGLPDPQNAAQYGTAEGSALTMARTNSPTGSR